MTHVKEREDILRKEQSGNSRKLQNLVNAVAAGGEVASLVGEIRKLETRQSEIEIELKELKPIPRIPRPEVESHLAEWRRLLRGSVIQARQVLQKIIKGRLLMIPLEDGVGYEFRADTRFDKLFQGLAIPVPQFVADHEPKNLGWEHLGPEDTPDSDREKLLKRGKAVASPTGSERPCVCGIIVTVEATRAGPSWRWKLVAPTGVNPFTLTGRVKKGDQNA